MEKTSEWLNSFNSDFKEEINALVSTRKLSNKKTMTIAITGGKGGVGKTSVSLKLAKEMAAQGSKVLLIDCDYNLSNTAIRLGIPVDNTFYSLVSAEKEFEDCLYKSGNFHLLSACNGSLDLFDTDLRLEEIIIDIINAHGKEFDCVFLDCPAGLMRESLTLNAYCDKRIVVVTPDRASITDSYSLVKVLNKKFGVNENHLLVNMVNSRTQFEKVVKTFSETIENFLGCRTKILGGIKKINVAQAQFDQYFLSSGKNDLHESFLQVIKKLTDELSRTTIKEGSLPLRSSELLEQEVH
jgi:flagellar biosynthesis protein FlhG